MYDLRVVVEEIKGFCDLPMQVGDFFYVRGGRLIVPEGKHVCIWALQSLMPLLPLKQRDSAEENDWVPHTNRMCCPDPHGMVIYRIDRVPVGANDPLPASEAKPSGIPRMQVTESLCSGCRACELTCSFAHERQFSDTFSRIQVEKDESLGLDRPAVCRQCGVAPCVEACPRQALSKGTHHEVVVDESLCSGCRACAKACHFGAIHFRAGGKTPLICDLCGGDPQCVKRCATGAISFGTERGQTR
jgi:uncharacterized repeat protein (TIGR04076 family)